MTNELKSVLAELKNAVIRWKAERKDHGPSEGMAKRRVNNLALAHIEEVLAELDCVTEERDTLKVMAAKLQRQQADQKNASEQEKNVKGKDGDV